MVAAPPCPPARKTCVAVDRIRKLCRRSVRALRRSGRNAAGTTAAT